jgi:hypothetical protein
VRPVRRPTGAHYCYDDGYVGLCAQCADRLIGGVEVRVPLGLGPTADDDFPLFQLTREVRKEVAIRARGPSIWLYGEAGAEPQPCRCGSSGFPLSQEGRDYLERHMLLGRLYCPGCEAGLAVDLA